MIPGYLGCWRSAPGRASFSGSSSTRLEFERTKSAVFPSHPPENITHYYILSTSLTVHLVLFYLVYVHVYMSSLHMYLTIYYNSVAFCTAWQDIKWWICVYQNGYNYSRCDRYYLSVAEILRTSVHDGHGRTPHLRLDGYDAALPYLRLDRCHISGTSDCPDGNLAFLQQRHHVVSTADYVCVSRLVRHESEVCVLPEGHHLKCEQQINGQNWKTKTPTIYPS